MTSLRARMLVHALVTDAHRLLGHLPEQQLGPRAAEAVALLALIAGQDVEPAEGSDGTDGRWRIAQRVAPDRVISTVDPDTRHAHKSMQRRQDGFKAHLSIEPDTGIITECALTKASGEALTGSRSARHAPAWICSTASTSRCGYWPILLTVQGNSARNLLSVGMSIFQTRTDPPSGSGRIHRRRLHRGPHRGHRDLPCRCDPQDHTHRSRGLRHACRNCPLRDRCTTCLGPDYPNIRRARLTTVSRPRKPPRPELAERLSATPPMVERTIAWMVRGNRQLRYRGDQKRPLAAPPRRRINLRRLIALGPTHTGTAWALA